MGEIIELTQRRPPTDSREAIRRDLAVSLQELMCALALLNVAEDAGWPARMAREMSVAMRVATRACAAIDGVEDWLQAMSGGARDPRWRLCPLTSEK